MERYLNDAGNFVNVVPREEVNPLDRQIDILKKEKENMKIALDQKRDEIKGMKQQLNEASPILKEDVIAKDKLISRLKTDIQGFLEKEKEFKSAMGRVSFLEKENESLKKELNAKSKPKK